ncbi:MAG: TRAP transporter small permease [Proteobacteria bacterium]|nr:TRAP transporter small permease [Pseudomonadota bacterium]
MSLLEGFRRGVHKVTYGVCIFGMFLAIPLMLITTFDVLSRGFFNKPIPGTLELSEYMLAIIILLGAAYTQQVQGHVAVDFLTSKFSLRGQKICKIITDFASLFIIAVLTIYGYSEGIHETTVSDQLRVPQWPFKLLVAVGGFMLWMEILLDLLTSIAALTRREEWTR